MGIILLDSTSSSLTVSWTEIPNAKRYILQYRQPSSDTFETLSAKLTSTQARKRNLQDDEGNGFFFRVGAITTSNEGQGDNEQSVKEWLEHAEPFHLLSKDSEKQHQMDAPKVVLAGSNQAVVVSWISKNSSGGATTTTKYELQMRENQGGIPWNTIASSLSGTEVRKKNLTSKVGYQFRVRQANDGPNETPFSSPSDPIVALGLSPGIKRWFSTLENGQLIAQNNKTISLEDALGGKEFVLLYASAHWCGPCRQFTPQLANWYSRGAKNQGVEVVFLSADHDENGFESYFKTMPWLSIDYDDDTREGIMAQIRVTGIPRLVVLDGRTGRIIEDNAVGKPLDINKWRQQAKGK